LTLPVPSCLHHLHLDRVWGNASGPTTFAFAFAFTFFDRLIDDQRPTTNPRVEVNEISCQFSAS
jgi:hypothetical protein